MKELNKYDHGYYDENKCRTWDASIGRWVSDEEIHSPLGECIGGFMESPDSKPIPCHTVKDGDVIHIGYHPFIGVGEAVAVSQSDHCGERIELGS